MASTAVQDMSELYLRFAAKIGVITDAEYKRERSNYVGMQPTAIGKALVEKGVLHSNNFKLLESMFARQLSRTTQVVQAPPPVASKAPTEKFTKADVEKKEEIDVAKGDTTKLKGSPVSASRYKIVRPLTTSRCSELFVAEDLELHREVVLKRLLPQHQKAPGYRIRFNRTAEVTSGLEHPCIPPIYNHGLDPEGRPFYTTRLLAGETLTESVHRLFEGEPADPPRSIETRNRQEGLRKHVQRLIQVCSAVSYAHARGVVHCGLTPDRILIGKYSETLVVGWGRSELIYGRKPKSEATDGKPAASPGPPGKGQSRSENPTPYTSPEQLMSTDGSAGGILSDVYSLGAILHFVLTGKPPFNAAPDDLSAAAQVGRDSVATGEAAAASRTLSDICAKAMTIDPSQRHAGVREFAAALEEWLDAKPGRAVLEPTVPAVPLRGPRTPPRIQTRIAVAACAVCTLAGLLLGRTVFAGAKPTTAAAVPLIANNEPTPHADPTPVPQPQTAVQVPDLTPYVQVLIAAAVQSHQSAADWASSLEKRMAQKKARADVQRAAVDGRFTEALSLSDKHAAVATAVERAEWLAAAGRNADALSEFERVASTATPDELRAVVGLAEARLATDQSASKEIERAKSLLSAARPTPTVEARLATVEGRHALKSKKPTEAVALLEAATESWSRITSSKSSTAQELIWAANSWDATRLLHSQEQKPAEAVNAADNAIALLRRIPAKTAFKERVADLENERALSLVQLGRLADAEKAFGNVVDAEAAGSVNARYLRGACRIELKNVAGARQDAESLTSLRDPTSKYLGARIFSRLSGLKDAAPTDGNRAMAVLKELTAADYFTGDRAELPKTDPDLEAVRQRADFTATVSPPRDAKATSSPSARAP
jgi:serine/threonine protein kinase